MNNNLERFKTAQAHSYSNALQEIRNGHKTSHWMWYIFPQLRDLARSNVARYYGINSVEEARAYLADPVLGGRLVEISEALMELKEKDAEMIFGCTDAKKLRSCMTLFSVVSEKNSIFQRVLDAYYDGKADQKTLGLL